MPGEVICVAMTATAASVIGSILVSWKRKILTLHTLGKVEELVSGTIFSKGFDVGFTPIFFFVYNALYQLKPLVNTLRTGDADLRFYITTVQDG